MAVVNVQPLGDPDDDAATTFMAELSLACAECGASFGFRGVPVGVSLGKPMVDVTGTTLRVALMTPAEMELRGGLAGLSQAEGGAD